MILFSLLPYQFPASSGHPTDDTHSCFMLCNIRTKKIIVIDFFHVQPTACHYADRVVTYRVIRATREHTLLAFARRWSTATTNGGGSRNKTLQIVRGDAGCMRGYDRVAPTRICAEKWGAGSKEAWRQGKRERHR